jgi:hypothetical protein
MYIRCSCYMFLPHMGHHQATFIIWGDHCTVHFVLSNLRHIVVVVNLLRRIFSCLIYSNLHYSLSNVDTTRAMT